MKKILTLLNAVTEKKSNTIAANFQKIKGNVSYDKMIKCADIAPLHPTDCPILNTTEHNMTTH
jgi:hypothetical protein